MYFVIQVISWESTRRKHTVTSGLSPALSVIRNVIHKDS